MINKIISVPECCKECRTTPCVLDENEFGYIVQENGIIERVPLKQCLKGKRYACINTELAWCLCDKKKEIKFRGNRCRFFLKLTEAIPILLSWSKEKQ